MKLQFNLFFVVIFLFSFFQLTCKEEPIIPCNDCPSPSDTTSHNFTWQKYTWGGGGSSSINDVAIINDTNIWVVGDINLPDSIAQDSHGHNRPRCIAHWNGKTWDLQYIAYMPPGSIGDSLSAKVNAIFARDDHDIWIAAGYMFHYDGVKWTPHYNTDAEGSTKIWGDNSGKLWCVGRNGSIIYYNGSNWQKLQSGTTFNFQDIYGAKDSKTGEWEILALTAQYDTLPVQSQLFRIEGTAVSVAETFFKIYFSVWFEPGEKYYLSGDGILWKNKLSDASWVYNPMGTITNNTSGSIRGNNLNDVFISQLYLDVLHFNGASWLDYHNVIPGGFGSYSRIALKGNTMVAGGWIDQKAIVLLGKR